MDTDDILGQSRWGFELAPHDLFVRLNLDLQGAELRAAAARLVDQRAAVDPLIARRRRAWAKYVVRVWEDPRSQHALDAYAMVYDVSVVDLPDGPAVRVRVLAENSPGKRRSREQRRLVLERRRGCVELKPATPLPVYGALVCLVALSATTALLFLTKGASVSVWLVAAWMVLLSAAGAVWQRSRAVRDP